MKIFVTGASGFVGGRATERLVESGHDVVAMSRSSNSDSRIIALGAEPVRCDLENVNKSHLRNCDVVVHAAAYVDTWGPGKIFDKINVDGTRLLLQAARQAGVRRFIHISSDSALVNGQSLDNVDEEYPLAINSPYDYCRTKALSEKLVLEASDEAAEFITLALRPRLIWGAGDNHFLPQVKQMVEQGTWKWINGGSAITSTTYIENLVDAVELCLTHGRSGQAYFIVDEGEQTTRDMIGLLAQAAGFTPPPDNSVSSGFAMAVATVYERIWKVFRRKGSPPLTRTAVMLATIDSRVNGALAGRELGFKPRFTVDQGLQHMAHTLGKDDSFATRL